MLIWIWTFDCLKIKNQITGQVKWDILQFAPDNESNFQEKSCNKCEKPLQAA